MNLMSKIFEKLVSKFTDKHTKIPLFYVTFNYQKYLKDGANESCYVHFHPDLQNDIKFQTMIFDVIDYIRNNYDMKNFTKI